MKPEVWLAIFAGITLVSQGANVVLFLRIRVAQLEGEQRVLDKVDDKLKEYVRKDSNLLDRPHSAIC